MERGCRSHPLRPCLGLTADATLLRNHYGALNPSEVRRRLRLHDVGQGEDRNCYQNLAQLAAQETIPAGPVERGKNACLRKLQGTPSTTALAVELGFIQTGHA